MSRYRLLAILFGIIPVLAFSQGLTDYLQARKKNSISSVSSIKEVETFVGAQVFEISGVVKGIIGSGDNELLLVEGSNGSQLYVHANPTPDWMRNGQVQARILIHASRRAESAMLDAQLISAVSEYEIAKTEAKTTTKPKVVVTKPAVRTGGNSTSRRGGRPRSLPGEVPKYTTEQPVTNVKKVASDISSVLPSYSAFVKKRNPKLSDEQAEHIAERILAYSAHFGVDARLIVAIIVTESDFDPNEKSHAGAMGLGQLMPVNVKELGLNNGYDIEQNLWGTVKLVRGHIDKYSKQTDDSFEALVLALAGYNAGNGAVKKYGGVPPYKETQDYVRKVISRYQQLCGK